jgi:hypothetical protein
MCLCKALLYVRTYVRTCTYHVSGKVIGRYTPAAAMALTILRSCSIRTSERLGLQFSAALTHSLTHSLAHSLTPHAPLTIYLSLFYCAESC